MDKREQAKHSNTQQPFEPKRVQTYKQQIGRAWKPIDQSLHPRNCIVVTTTTTRNNGLLFCFCGNTRVWVTNQSHVKIDSLSEPSAFVMAFIDTVSHRSNNIDNDKNDTKKGKRSCNEYRKSLSMIRAKKSIHCSFSKLEQSPLTWLHRSHNDKRSTKRFMIRTTNKTILLLSIWNCLLVLFDFVAATHWT